VSATSTAIPVIDIGDLEGAHGAAAIDGACRTSGFFALRADAEVNAHRGRVIEAARRLFALPIESKRHVALATGGTAWRGWFPLGDELTSGVPDLKEGFYVGREEPPDPRPLHGPNVWPAELPELRHEVLSWMRRMEALAQRALAAMAVGLGLEPNHFVDGLTHDPTVLFRIFLYPPQPPTQHDRWGVAEHSDYGLLTLLAHDGTPGLQVRVDTSWIEVDPDPQLLICNIGDMLDRLTGGRYCSTPHRVRNVATNDRISLPFFLDPGWAAPVDPLLLGDHWTVPSDRAPRWDRTNLADVSGTYGDWLIAKVRQVFPQLASTVLEDPQANDR
jgi:isopenicillin N synthase-like dioxygenase